MTSRTSTPVTSRTKRTRTIDNSTLKDVYDKEVEIFVKSISSCIDISSFLKGLCQTIGITQFHSLITRVVYAIRMTISLKSGHDDVCSQHEIDSIHLLVHLLMYVCQENNNNINLDMSMDLVIALGKPLCLYFIRQMPSELLEKLFRHVVLYLDTIAPEYENVADIRKKSNIHIRSACRILQTLAPLVKSSSSIVSVLSNSNGWYQRDVVAYLWHCQDLGVHTSKSYNQFTIMHHPKLLTFRNKLYVLEIYGIDYQNKYRDMVHMNQRGLVEEEEVTLSPTCNLTVDRDNIVESVIQTINEATNPLMPLRIFLRDDEKVAVDAGGVKVEIFHEFFQHLMDPKRGYFVSSEEQQSLITPVHVPISDISTEKGKEILTRFFNIGRLMALALSNRVRITLPLGICFFKQLVGQEITEADFKKDYPVTYRSLEHLRNFKGTDEEVQEAFGFEFQIDRMIYDPTSASEGKLKTQLLPLSETIDAEKPVTMADREMFIHLYWRGTCHAQHNPVIASMLCGFHNVLPLALMQMFEPEELAALSTTSVDRIPFDKIVSGIQFLSFDNNDNEDNAYKEMFLSVIKTRLNVDEQRSFFKYITSYSDFPASCLPMPILRVHNHKSSPTTLLPTASSCTNTLLLPRYSNADELERKLKIAIQYATSFGLS